MSWGYELNIFFTFLLFTIPKLSYNARLKLNEMNLPPDKNKGVRSKVPKKLGSTCNAFNWKTIIIECVYSTNLEQLKIFAETSLKTMKEWYSENGLKMNSNKTQCIIFETPNFNKRTETFQITIDDIYGKQYRR